MQLMLPSYEILTPDGQPINGSQILQYIERIARTCYKSEDRITETSAVRFVKNLLNHDPPHEAMLEFYDVVVKFTTDRGVSHELVRHRLASYAQESTRFVNYGKRGCRFILPPWVNIPCGEYPKGCQSPVQDLHHPDATWFDAMRAAEGHYLALLEAGWTPQQARGVLPNSTKTEIVAKYNLREWRHIFRMRIFSNAHPQMYELTRPLLDEFKRAVPLIFDDLSYQEPDPNAIPTKLSCPVLRKAGRLEPIFVLRAQDEIAPDALRDWAERADMRGVSATKIAHALEIAAAMDAWPTRKLPD